MGIINLFSESGTPSTLLFLSLVGISGILLGKIKIFNVKLGIAGVLFTGLLVGHLGARSQAETLHFVKEFGLILFVYSIGLDVGPRFLSSLKSNGLKLNFLAVGIVVLGFLCAIGLKLAFDIPTPVITGIMCGAVTNTPGLGAAQQVIQEQLSNPQLTELAGMAYAVAYPFGIIGIILTMLIIRGFFRIKVQKEAEDFSNKVSGVSGKLEAVNLKVSNQALEGKTIAFLRETLSGEFVLSRIFRNNEFIIPEEDDTIQTGDTLYGVSTKQNFNTLELKVGKLEKTGDLNITGRLGMRHVVFTNKKLAGKTIKEIGISRRFPVNITRIFRFGSEIMPSENDSVEFGDTIRIVGKRKALDEVAKLLGNSMKELSHPNIIPILIGIFAGVLLGSIPFAIPGLPAPAKLGLAGGPLLVALFLGHKGRIGKLDFYMTPGANLFIRELGIILFLACVGLGAGKHFVETIINGGYMWMVYGVAITAIPILIIGFIARFLKFNYLSICGLLAGSMTDPPALEFANSQAPVQAQSTAYATVYPLVMFLRILLAQALVLIFL
ncbi:putative transporter [Maribellus sp. CM-23]|uniref:putative transporter n=1 Tax=Maribellus sp. CM-23 TaxID=2781026 RepID=UPI001F195ACE|nr:putative transporter [Maribellus sp. CM-23]MCE4564600.1 putative transporter [Maribellus sp. CM-23]